jgi:soluble lytic murein transglycosylase-like protein
MLLRLVLAGLLAVGAGTSALASGAVIRPTEPAAKPQPAAATPSAVPVSGPATAAKVPVEALIARHALRYKLPESLIRRVVLRESRFNPNARHGPFWGLMQLRLDTARGMGYRGAGPGLLDADTNLTYGVAYLANAWRVARGNENRAVALYTSGFYYEAKRKGLLADLLKTAVLTDTVAAAPVFP